MRQVVEKRLKLSVGECALRNCDGCAELVYSQKEIPVRVRPPKKRTSCPFRSITFRNRDYPEVAKIHREF